MKEHKSILELTLKEHDLEMVTEKVQDRVAESWDDVEKQSEEIIKNMKKVKDTLAQLLLNIAQ
jgi:hypothetical protein